MESTSSQTNQPSGRVFVIGAGMVGATSAYAILNRKVAKEIYLIDIAEEMLNAQVDDLQHAAVVNQPTLVKKGSYEDIKENDIIVITAGASTKGEQSRLELSNINVKIIKQIVANVMKNGVPVYILMVTNPVDVLTYIAYKDSGLPKERVFGSGTSLDTYRLRAIMEQKHAGHLNDSSVRVLGEHGDSSVAILPAAMNPTEEARQELMKMVHEAAYNIIQGKGSTYFGIGSAVAEICTALLTGNELQIPLSLIANGEYGVDGIAIGLPGSINSSGARIVDFQELSPVESKLLQESAAVIRGVLSNHL